MRIGLLTEGGYPYVSGDAGLWCDRLVRGLAQHEFDIYALSRTERQEDAGWVDLPSGTGHVRTAPLWHAEPDGIVHGRRARRRFATHYGDLATALCAAGPVLGFAPDAPGDATTTDADADGAADGRGRGSTGGRVYSAEGAAELADRFAGGLYGLAELARDEGGLVAALRSETAVRILERACRAPGARQAVRTARVPDLLTVAAHLERVLRPLSLDWYEDDGLGAADLCHATAGGVAALPGLLTHHFFGVPLLVTEYGVRLRSHYLASTATDAPPAVRSLVAAFHSRLATEVYRRAAVITPGNTHARRWQERCGADRAKLRTVHPGIDAAPFTGAGEASGAAADPDTLVWVGPVEPAKDLVSLLHAFVEVRRAMPDARLRIVGTPAGPEGAAYLEHCKALAARLFPAGRNGRNGRGTSARSADPSSGQPRPLRSLDLVRAGSPVVFDEIGGWEAPTRTDAYALGAVVVLSSVVEGFPAGLVEAMLCARATVSTDVGAVVEVVGGTGLVVPARNPRALAEACVDLLRDPERRARLGAAARARALELFTVEQNLAAFHGIYLDVVSHSPRRPPLVDDADGPHPFAVPAEARVPGGWPGPRASLAARGAMTPEVAR